MLCEETSMVVVVHITQKHVLSVYVRMNKAVRIMKILPL